MHPETLASARPAMTMDKLLFMMFPAGSFLCTCTTCSMSCKPSGVPGNVRTLCRLNDACVAAVDRHRPRMAALRPAFTWPAHEKPTSGLRLFASQKPDACHRLMTYRVEQGRRH